jgi:hypothetical protein
MIGRQLTTGAPNGDFEQEQERLLRKRKIAEAMLGSAIKPMNTNLPDGGTLPSWAPLAKGLQAWMAKRNMDKIDTADQANNARGDEMLRTGVQDVVNAQALRPGPQAAPADGVGPIDEMSPDMVQSKQREAVIRAMSAGHPQLRQLGQFLFQEGLKKKEGLTAKDVLPHADADTAERIGASVVPGFKAKRDVKVLGPGVAVNDSGNIHELKPGAPAPGQAPAQLPPIPQGMVDMGTAEGHRIVKDPKTGDIYQQTGTGLKLVNDAPKTTVVNNNRLVNQAESEFLKTVGKGAGDEVNDARKLRKSAQEAILSMQQLEQIEARPGGVTNTGALADMTMAVGTIAAGFGMPVDRQKLANSQQYQGEVMQQLSGQLTGSLARSTTDKDMEILKAPRRQVTLKAQERIAFADDIDRQLATQFPEAARINGSYPGVATPQRTMDKGPAMTLQDYMNQVQRRGR